MRRILLFDTIIDGHHADYLAHLVNYWLCFQPEGELLVVTQASFGPIFQQLLHDNPSKAAVRFIPIPPEDIEQTHQSSALGRSFSEWNLQLKYIHAYQPTHALIMYVDIFQLGSWLGRKAPCAVSGIYFRPDFHYAIPPGVKARLNVLRKKVTLRGMLNRGVLTNLFCLDHSAIAALKKMSPRTNVLALPDPVKSYAIAPAETEQLRAELAIEPGRKIFLLFGHLDDRKGIEPLLEALMQLNPALRSTLCLLLVGSIRPAYQASIERQIAEVDPQIQIVCVFKEVRGRQIQTYFEISDYSLALYQRHIGMASVIIRSAVSGKPILSSDYGYMGRFVQAEQLGAVTDSTSPKAICQLLEQVLTKGLSYSSANLKKVADQNSDVAFAETIFKQL